MEALVSFSFGMLASFFSPCKNVLTYCVLCSTNLGREKFFFSVLLPLYCHFWFTVAKRCKSSPEGHSHSVICKLWNNTHQQKHHMLQSCTVNWQQYFIYNLNFQKCQHFSHQQMPLSLQCMALSSEWTLNCANSAWISTGFIKDRHIKINSLLLW